MTGSKITSMTSEQMRAARSRGESRTDWERVRREAGLSDQPASGPFAALAALRKS